MTLFLIAVSVGRWFKILSIGCRRSHAARSFASLTAYATNSASGAVLCGTGKCGLLGTGSMMGLLAVSLTGVCVRTSIRESSAARYTSHPMWSPCRLSSLRLVSSASYLLRVGPEFVEESFLHYR